MLQMRTQGKRMKRGASLFLALCMIVGMLPPVPVRAEGESSSAETVHVSDEAGLRLAIANKASHIILDTSIDVSCGTVNSIAGASDANACELIITSDLVLEGANQDVVLKRAGKNNNRTNVRSLLGVNSVSLTIKNLIVDGGAVWKDSDFEDVKDGANQTLGTKQRFKADTVNAGEAIDGVSGRSIIDVYRKKDGSGGTLILDSGAVVRNGHTMNSTDTFSTTEKPLSTT